jgi:hypothetical protein
VVLAWLLLLLLASTPAPAGAATVRLTPAAGEAGARPNLLAADLPPGSPVELRVGRRAVRVLRTDAEGVLRTRVRIPGRARERVRVALQDARRQRVVLHYAVGSRWSGVGTSAAGDGDGRVLRLAADLTRGRLAAVARVRGLAPGARVAARYGGGRVGQAAAGEDGVLRLRLALPQGAVGGLLQLRGAGVGLAARLPTPPAVVVAAGDIACEPPYETTAERCRHAETAALTERLDPDAVAIPGDIQYRSGTMSEFRGSFHGTWGQITAPLRPVPGNHEYRTPGAADYFDYFAWQSGWRPPSWYAYDLGPWRLIALNSNCEPDRVECQAGSAQERWLRETLAFEPHRCTLAYWHHPRYSSGFHGSDPRTTPFWRALTEAGTELVIAGHDHHYERFAPQDENGRYDATGPREFVVGTGGSHLSVIHSPRAAHSELGDNRNFGVLLLKLYEDAYSWRFVDLEGRVLDFGRGSCF